MGPAGEDAVVDQYGRVHGVQGLRVLDISILPSIPRRGPNALAVMMGERAVEFFG
jgi:choline dehydrogenase-like flavoprotein